MAGRLAGWPQKEVKKEAFVDTPSPSYNNIHNISHILKNVYFHLNYSSSSSSSSSSSPADINHHLEVVYLCFFMIDSCKYMYWE